MLHMRQSDNDADTREIYFQVPNGAPPFPTPYFLEGSYFVSCRVARVFFIYVRNFVYKKYYRGLEFVLLGFKSCLILQSVRKVNLNLSLFF